MPFDEKAKQAAIEKVKAKDVEFIHLLFTDVLGYLKTISVTSSELEHAMDEGMGFDGSSVQGFTRLEESDMIAFPDPSTLKIRQSPSDGTNVASMFCNIETPDGEPFEGDPREVLKRVLKKAADMGYTAYMGPECEYFYLKDAGNNPTGLDTLGYFDQSMIDLGSQIRSDTVLRLRNYDIEVEYSHHEAAPSQHEIDLRYKDALTMADQVISYRTIVKETAALSGVHATFMPKPLNGVNGSGMHVHQSLFTQAGNAFYDAGAKFQLSAIARSYIAGLLRHAPAFSLVTNQWVNSYKRLVAGFEAPVYLIWAHLNRSALVRVPLYKPGKEAATRIELRSPDPACNPYLAFAAMIAAGLDGIERGLEPPEDTEYDVFELSEEEIEAEGIELLPGDLNEAIKAFEESALMREVMGEQVFKYLLANKRAEWDAYRTRVSTWEIESLVANV
ncbi:MAG: glutamine synthetase family protein [Coriobacteriia bacterium]|nr:glutamine synthetase family protein [Coriobacteriia bacterium]